MTRLVLKGRITDVLAYESRMEGDSFRLFNHLTIKNKDSMKYENRDAAISAKFQNQ